MQRSRNLERSPALREKYYSQGLGDEEVFFQGWEYLHYWDEEGSLLMKGDFLKKKKKNSFDWWGKTDRKTLNTKPKNGKVDKRNANSHRRVREQLFLQKIKEMGEMILDELAIVLIEDHAAERYHWA